MFKPIDARDTLRGDHPAVEVPLVVLRNCSTALRSEVGKLSARVMVIALWAGSW